MNKKKALGGLESLYVWVERTRKSCFPTFSLGYKLRVFWPWGGVCGSGILPRAEVLAFLTQGQLAAPGSAHQSLGLRTENYPEAWELDPGHNCVVKECGWPGCFLLPQGSST